MGCFVDDINLWSMDSVRTLFNQTRTYFEYPNKSSTQTKFEKLSWETVCHNLRRNKGVLVGEDPEQVQAEEMEHTTTLALPQTDASVVHGSTGGIMIPVHVSNQNPIAEQEVEEETGDVVMEEATAEDSASAEKESAKATLV